MVHLVLRTTHVWRHSALVNLIKRVFKIQNHKKISRTPKAYSCYQPPPPPNPRKLPNRDK